jgi:hypothetical protein
MIATRRPDDPRLDPGISIWLDKADFEPQSLSWHLAEETTRRAYWRDFARLALQIKDAELADGIGADGQRLHPIAYTTYLARSNPSYSPMGRADPDAATLSPCHSRSRTRSYLRARVLSAAVVLYWRFDSHTGEYWGVCLARHRDGFWLVSPHGRAYVPPRDVIGFGPSGMASLKAGAESLWRGRPLGPERPIPPKPGRMPAFVTESGKVYRDYNRVPVPASEPGGMMTEWGQFR